MPLTPFADAEKLNVAGVGESCDSAPVPLEAALCTTGFMVIPWTLAAGLEAFVGVIGTFAAEAGTFGAVVEPVAAAFAVAELAGALGAEIEPFDTAFAVVGLVGAPVCK